MVKKNIPIRLKLLKNINNKSLMFMSVIKSHYDVDIDPYKYIYMYVHMFWHNNKTTSYWILASELCSLPQTDFDMGV